MFVSTKKRVISFFMAVVMAVLSIQTTAFSEETEGIPVTETEITTEAVKQEPATEEKTEAPTEEKTENQESPPTQEQTVSTVPETEEQKAPVQTPAQRPQAGTSKRENLSLPSETASRYWIFLPKIKGIKYRYLKKHLDLEYTDENFYSLVYQEGEEVEFSVTTDLEYVLRDSGKPEVIFFDPLEYLEEQKKKDKEDPDDKDKEEVEEEKEKVKLVIEKDQQTLTFAMPDMDLELYAETEEEAVTPADPAAQQSSQNQPNQQTGPPEGNAQDQPSGDGMEAQPETPLPEPETEFSPEVAIPGAPDSGFSAEVAIPGAAETEFSPEVAIPGAADSEFSVDVAVPGETETQAPAETNAPETSDTEFAPQIAIPGVDETENVPQQLTPPTTESEFSPEIAVPGASETDSEAEALTPPTTESEFSPEIAIPGAEQTETQPEALAPESTETEFSPQIAIPGATETESETSEPGYQNGLNLGLADPTLPPIVSVPEETQSESAAETENPQQLGPGMQFIAPVPTETESGSEQSETDASVSEAETEVETEAETESTASETQPQTESETAAQERKSVLSWSIKNVSMETSNVSGNPFGSGAELKVFFPQTMGDEDEVQSYFKKIALGLLWIDKLENQTVQTFPFEATVSLPDGSTQVDERNYTITFDDKDIVAPVLDGSAKVAVIAYEVNEDSFDGLHMLDSSAMKSETTKDGRVVVRFHTPQTAFSVLFYEDDGETEEETEIADDGKLYQVEPVESSLYRITLPKNENGGYSPGDVVYFSVTPKLGYRVNNAHARYKNGEVSVTETLINNWLNDEDVVTYGGSDTDEPEYDGYESLSFSFTMPNADVKLTGEVAPYTLTIAASTDDDWVVSNISLTIMNGGASCPDSLKNKGGYTKVKKATITYTNGQKKTVHAYCMQPHLLTPDDGSYDYGKLNITQITDAGGDSSVSSRIARTLYYMYEGPAWGSEVEGSDKKTPYNVKETLRSAGCNVDTLDGKTGVVKEAYFMTHMLLSYIYSNGVESTWNWGSSNGPEMNYPCMSSTGINVIKQLDGIMQKLPDAKAYFSKGTSSSAPLNSADKGGYYASQQVSYYAPRDNKATISLPDGVSIVIDDIESKPEKTGDVTIEGGTTFHFKSTKAFNKTVEYKFKTSKPVNFDSYAIHFSGKQDIGFAYDYGTKKLSVFVQWEGTPMKQIKVIKKIGGDVPIINAQKDLIATYGIFEEEACKTQVGKITTDVNGEGTSELLPIKDYWVKEIENPENLTFDPDLPKKVSMKENDDTPIYTINSKDYYKRIKITKKVGNNEGKLLAGKSLNGIVFGVYKDQKCTDKQCDITIEDKGNGTGSGVSEYMPIGTYYVREDVVPPTAGLTKDPTFNPYVVVLDDNGADGHRLIEIESNDYYIQITLQKSSDHPELPIEGAIYGIYTDQACTAKIEELKTNAAGYACSPYLPVPESGFYYVKEITAPAGYTLDTQVKTVTVSDTITALDQLVHPVTSFDTTITTKTGYLHLHKEVAGGTLPPGLNNLAGVTYTVYKDESKTQYFSELTTDANGDATIGPIPLGTYFLYETKWPSGLTQDTQVHQVVLDEAHKDGTVTFTAVDSTETTQTETPPPPPAEASIGVHKSSSFDELPDGYTLAGAVYVIYDDESCTHEVGRMTTGADGTASYGTLPLGTYWVREETAPDGMTVDSTKHKVTLTEADADQTVYFDSVDGVVTAKIELQKVDPQTGSADPYTTASSKYSYYGATYGLYDDPSCSHLLETMTTDDYGYAQSRNSYPAGTYYVKEISPPTNGLYEMDYTVHPVTISKGNSSTVYVETEDPKKPLPSVHFFKYLANKKEAEAWAKVVKIGKMTQAHFEMTHEDAGILGSWGRKSFNLNADGSATVTDLLPGVWTLRETQAPIGYKTIPDLQVTVVMDQLNEQSIPLDDDKEYYQWIEIVKKDADSGNIITMDDAVFKIVDEYGDDMELYVVGSSGPSKTFQTKDGVVQFKDPLPGGIYQLYEVSPPAGYQPYSGFVEFRIVADGTAENPLIVEMRDPPVKHRIEVEKIDSSTGEHGGAGYEFQVIVASDVIDGAGKVREVGDPKVPWVAGTVVDTITTGANGIATSGELYVGSYYVKETAIPAGGGLAATEERFLIQSKQEMEPELIQFQVQDNPTSLLLHKVDSLNYGHMAGIKFRIKEKGTADDNSQLYVTDADGNLTVDHLKAGTTYTIQEVETLPGYDVPETVYEFTVDENGKIDGKEVYEVTITNKPNEIHVSKQDVTNGEELPGAFMTITDENGETIDSWVSTDQPHVIYRMKAGNYTLTETAPPELYELEASIPFTVTDSLEIQTVTMKDSPYREVVVEKKDLEGKEFIPDCTLTVRDSEGQVVDTWTTVTEPHSLGQLKAGTYTLTEDLSAPGYVTSKSITFEVKKTTATDFGPLTITMKDDTTKSQFSKKDITTGEELPGAHMQITDSEGKVVAEWDSTDKPYLIEKLPVGKYKLTETAAPDKYETAAEIEFEVLDNGEIQSFTMNDFPYREVHVSKKALTGEDEVPGASLEIRDAEGNLMDSWVSGEEPHITWLPHGTYTLKETHPADGYVTADPVEFEVLPRNTEGDFTVQDVEMRDDKTKLRVSKKDVTTGEELPGAHLKITDSNGEVVAEWDSTEEPFYIEELPIGKYTLVEEYPPELYQEAAKVEFEILDTGEIQQAEIFDFPYRDVSFSKKTLTGEEELPGAHLQILDSEGNVVDEWVSGEEQHVTKLPEGHYTMKETKPADGYVTAEQVEFDVQPRDEEGDFEVQYVEMRDDVTKVQVSKKDITNNEELSGATLTITDDSGEVLYRWVSSEKPYYVEKLPIGWYTLTEVYPPELYQPAVSIDFQVLDTGEIQMVELFDIPYRDVSVSKKELTGEEEIPGARLEIHDAEGNLMDKWVSNGEPHIVQLPEGKYTLTEVIPAAGYVTADPVEFEVLPRDSEGDVEVQYVEMRDDVTKVQISKKDVTNSEEMPGAHLTITDEEGNVVDEWVSDGTPHYREKLPTGKYTLTETAPPEYYQTAESVEFTVDDTGEIQQVEMFDAPYRDVSVSKKELTGEEEIPGTKMQIKNADTGEVVDEWVTTGEPHVVPLPEGRYLLVEAEPAPGYVTSVNVEFEVYPRDSEGDIEVLHVEMRDDFTKVEVSKKDMTNGEELPGATLTVTDENGNVIDEWVSGDTPHYMEKLKPGKYTLTEKTAPDGYDVAENVEFEVTDDGDIVQVEMFDRPLREVQFSKKDVTDQEEIPGAHLKIEDEEGNVIDEWVSTGEPHGTLLAQGRYTLTETFPAAGYVTAETVVFDVLPRESEGDVEVQHVEMYDDITKLEVSKKDITNGEELPGAQLTITDENGKVVDEWVSEDTPHYLDRLPVGKYTLTEVTSPDGYDVAESIEFEILDTGEIQQVEMFDAPFNKVEYTQQYSDDEEEEAPGTHVTFSETPQTERKEEVPQVVVSKQDLTTKEELPGAKLQIQDANGNVVEEWESTTQPHYMQMLPAGTYTLTEVSAPAGYDKAETIQFEISDTGVTKRVVMYDKARIPKTGDDIKFGLMTVLFIVIIVLLIIGVSDLLKKRKHGPHDSGDDGNSGNSSGDDDPDDSESSEIDQE